jgi:phosphopentomutase
MTRAFLVVMDSVGIGGAPDADQFFNGLRPDTRSNTLGHIAKACVTGQANDGRSGELCLPNMARLGVWEALFAASGMDFRDDETISGIWGHAREYSHGKDTPSGHWELAGLPVPWDWHYFPNETPAFPVEIDRAVEAAGYDGMLGNCHASGTEILAQLGAEHLKTGLPICYTSADSVFQIAAHEEAFGLERLYALCEAVAPLLHEMRVGRVIARPFVGNASDGFTRTQNRKDYAITPPKPVLTNWVQEAGRKVRAIGKIGDIFSMQGIDEVVKGEDATLMRHLNDAVRDMPDGSLTFANFVEFDAFYGHRRDVSGYARALEWFDCEIGAVLSELRAGDMMILCADHGNDPSWSGTDHTREQVPVLIAGRGQGSLGQIDFADVSAIIAAHLGIENRGQGCGVLEGMR